MDVLHPNIEAEILASILQQKYRDTYVLRFVDSGYFSVESYKWIVNYLKGRDWEPVTWEFLDSVLHSIEDAEKLELFRTQIWNLYSRELTYLKDAEKTFRDFVVVSVAKSGVRNSFEALERSKRADYFLKDLKDVIGSANTLLEGDKFQVSDWASDAEDRMSKRIYYRDNPDLNPVIRTGIKLLDAQIQIKGPMIVNFLAPFKGYKSIVLNSIGMAALFQGYNVFHGVLENTVELTADRYDSLFSGFIYDRLKSGLLTKEERESLKARQDLADSWKSRLKIVKGTPKESTMGDFTDQLKLMRDKEGFVPDVFILDYLNILNPVSFAREERIQQQRILWDIKKFVDTYNIPMITATQSTSEGNKLMRSEKGTESKRISSVHQGKAIDISQGVDVTISINQTPEEQQEGILAFMIDLARDANITHKEIIVDCDIPRMLITRDIYHLFKESGGF